VATAGRRAVARLYLWATAIAGIAVLACAAWAPGERAPSSLGLAAELVFLAVVAQNFPLSIGSQHKIDTSIVLYLACLLLFDPRTAVTLVGVSQLLGQLTLASRLDPHTRRPLRGSRGVLFNTGQVVLAAALGALVYGAFVPRQGAASLQRLENLWAIPATAATLQLANTLAVALMVTLQTGRSFRGIWLATWGIGIIERTGLFVTGVVMVLASKDYPWAPLVAALPMVILVLSQRRTLAVLAREQQARAQAEQAQGELAFLANASAVLGSSLDYGATLQSAARLPVPALADWCTIHVGQPDAASPRIAVAHADPLQEERLRALMRQSVTLCPNRHQGSQLCSSISDETLVAWAPDHEALRLLRELRPVSAMVVPLVAHGRTLGTVAVYTASPLRRYGPPDLAVAEVFARRMALAIDNARLYEEQRRIARQLEHLRGQLDASERERLLHDERGRIARELHDRVEQTFFSIGLTVSAALSGPRGSATDALRAALAEVSGAARQGAEDLRAAIFALNRAEVHDRGLVQALWQLVREFQQTTGVEADLVVSGAERRAPPEVAEALYAVAREGLANVEQHARASAVVVSLRFELGAATLTVQDDGVGAAVLVLTTLPESATRFGLRGMRERVVRQGGTFTAEPGDEGGFVVRAHVPLADSGAP